MTAFSLLAVGLGTTVLAVLFAVVCLLLMLFVLAQKPKGGGLSGAFGGGGGSGSEAAFLGAKAGDFLTLSTSGLFVVFLSLAIALVFATRPPAEPAVLDIADLDGSAAATDGQGGAGDAGEDPDADADADVSPGEALDSAVDRATPVIPTPEAPPAAANNPAGTAVPAPADTAPAAQVDEVALPPAGDTP